VALEVANNAQVFPAQGDPDHPEWLWPTTAIAYNMMVVMDNGESWTLKRPPVRLADSRIQVYLYKRGTSQISVFNVPAESVDVPIWNMGREYQPPAPQPAPTPVDNPVVDPPQNPTDTPTPPPAP
jgi:hypothetical protein